MIPYFDVHTHRPWHPETVPIKRIENLHQKSQVLKSIHWVSVGLHPWFLNADWEKDWNRIWENAQKHKVRAIGEAGLDKLCGIKWELQEKAFCHQIEMANHYQLPLIVHCVRAFPETLMFLKKANTPVIFHGFSGKYNRIEPVIKAGYFVSFGKAILTPGSAAQNALLQTPLNHILLETDGQDISIRSVYEAAAAIKGLTLGEFGELLLRNAKSLWGDLSIEQFL